MILYIILSVIMFVTILRVGHLTNFKRTHGLEKSKYTELSWPAQEIIKAYRSLPESNRPYTDIYSVVSALDLRSGGAAVATSKYSQKRRTYDGYVMESGWEFHSCSRYRQKCDFCDYEEIYNGIQAVKESLAEQQHKIALAGVASGLDAAKELASRLREESELLDTVTKELTNEG